MQSCYGGCYGYGYGGVSPYCGCASAAPYVATSGAPATIPVIPGAAAPAKPDAGPAKPPVKPRKDRDDEGTTALPAGAPAAVLVRLPADARLYANQRLTGLTSGERQFQTPELPAGQEFHYNFRMEVERDGKAVSESRQVVVRAGEKIRVEFVDPSDTLAADRARVSVKLPADARLFVDGQLTDLASENRAFDSTKLEAEKEYFFLVTAEVTRDGQKQAQTQRIVVRAGEKVRVDFSELDGQVDTARK
jgi:uncharacterized protein (TIGR03000 family)